LRQIRERKAKFGLTAEYKYKSMLFKGWSLIAAKRVEREEAFTIVRSCQD